LSVVCTILLGSYLLGSLPGSHVPGSHKRWALRARPARFSHSLPPHVLALTALRTHSWIPRIAPTCSAPTSSARQALGSQVARLSHAHMLGSRVLGAHVPSFHSLSHARCSTHVLVSHERSLGFAAVKAGRLPRPFLRVVWAGNICDFSDSIFATWLAGYPYLNNLARLPHAQPPARVSYARLTHA
jgi:hypothetical protein